VNPQTFVDFYTAKDWKIGKNAMKDWRAAVRTWEERSASDAAKSTGGALALRSDAWTDVDRERHQSALNAKVADQNEPDIDLRKLAAGTPLGKALAGRQFEDTG
jgi:hypothetical protein